jgi:hypothetical protein
MHASVYDCRHLIGAHMCASVCVEGGGGGTQDESVCDCRYLAGDMCAYLCMDGGGGGALGGTQDVSGSHEPRPAYLIHSKERLPHLFDLSRAHGERDRLQGDSLRHTGRGLTDTETQGDREEKCRLTAPSLWQQAHAEQATNPVAKQQVQEQWYMPYLQYRVAAESP